MAGGDDEETARHRPKGRFARFASLSRVTASVAARQLGDRVADTWRSDEAREEARSKTRKKSAEQIAATMGQLKGAAMKVGQMLSSDPELLPDEVTEALSTLQSEAPPMEPARARQAVEDALGQSIEDVFERFSDEPIGAASIGQVHRAMTKDGHDVAVKVQYPGIADTIRSDMKNLGSLLNLARTHLTREQVDRYLEEITSIIERESDYLHEADTLERFATVLKDVPGTRTPTPHFELCRPTLLVMEFVEGKRLFDWMDTQSPAAKTDMAWRLIESYIVMLHLHGCLHADPHPGNFLVDENNHLVFLDLGCVKDYDPAFGDGLLGVIRAMWRSDTDALMASLDSLGFDRSRTDPEVIHDWLELILEPLLEDQDWDYGAWRVQDRMMKFMKDNTAILHFAPPEDLLFYLRVLGGIRGLVGHHEVQLNVYRNAKALVDKHTL
jgi:predicted unusual protein kinase regulating ubiquinone biosynthesis (AarF/ABC1/UbiB family)